MDSSDRKRVDLKNRTGGAIRGKKGGRIMFSIGYVFMVICVFFLWVYLPRTLVWGFAIAYVVEINQGPKADPEIGLWLMLVVISAIFDIYKLATSASNDKEEKKD